MRFARRGGAARAWPCVFVVALLALGLVLRARGYLFGVIPFWLDEGSWALLLTDQPILDQLIRPIAFVTFSKLMALGFGLREASLRFLPWLSGLSAMLLAVPLSRRLFESTAARLLFIAILALHPNAIDFAKEFKPYSVSLGLHVACAFAAATYAHSRKTGWLVLTMSLAGFGILFAQDTLFVCPGVYLVIGYTAYRAKQYRHLVFGAVGAALSVGLTLGLYFLVWSRIATGGGSDTNYWGKKYDVFYLEGTSPGTLWSWTLDKLGELAAMPGVRRELWPEHHVFSREVAEQLQSIDAKLWWCLAALGLVSLAVRRRVVPLLLLVTPLLVFTAFGLLGYWPYGHFRTNLFALFYSAAFAAAAFELPLPKVANPSRWLSAVPALALVVLPLLVFERDWHRFKESTITGNYPIQEVFSTLLELQGRRPSDGEPDVLVIDLDGCDLWELYTQRHPDYVELGKELARRFRMECSHRKRGSSFTYGQRRRRHYDKTRVWYVLSRELEEFPKDLPDDLDVIGKRWVGVNQSTLIIGLSSS